MTNSSHTISAYVQRSPSNLVLEVLDGRTTLDRGWSPYVQTELVIKTPSNSTDFAYLDPRNTRRVTVTATRTIGGTTTTRIFDLALVAIRPSHNGGSRTMTLELASDESLLQDYALMASNPERQYTLDVRTCVLYALGKIGRSGALVTTDTATLTSATLQPTLTNLSTNPLALTPYTPSPPTTGWSNSFPGGIGGAATLSRGPFSGVLHNYLKQTYTTATTGAGGGVSHDVAVTPGKRYSVGVTYVNTSIATRMRLGIEWRTSGGTILSTDWSTDERPTTAGGGTGPMSLNNKEAPATAATARVLIRSVAGTGYANWSIGSILYVGELMFNEGTTVNEFFSGSGRGTLLQADLWPGLYVHAWTGTAHASTSTRTHQSHNDATIWKPGVSAWDWIRQILRAGGLQMWCDEARNWHVRPIGAGLPSGAPSTATYAYAYADNLLGGESAIARRSDSPWATGVVVHSRWVDIASGTQLESYDYAGTTDHVVTVESTVPNDTSAATILAKLATQGRVYTIEAVNDYTITPGQPLSITVAGESTASEVLRSVTWSHSISRNKRKPTMTLRTGDINVMLPPLPHPTVEPYRPHRVSPHAGRFGVQPLPTVS